MSDFSTKSTHTDRPFRSLQCGERSLDLSFPQVMGVLNVTPDSFSDGGDCHDSTGLNLDKALLRVERMLSEGAAIIDVGGESTRPGASPISPQQELDRVVPVVEAVASRFDTVISVDTSTPEVITHSARNGAGIINDVRALQRGGAIEAVVESGLPVCLMHMQGQPTTMQQQPGYTDVVAEVFHYLRARKDACIAAGIDKSQLIVDPGFGFGKAADHNLQLLENLPAVTELGCPVLVGLSRKSLIGQLTARPVEQRLAGSLALAVLAAERGASIIRVHDVAETVDAMKICKALKQLSLGG